ncbi:M48 family metalloprotease [Salinarimonas soli]|uniref:M48 family metalloprotease n=1 Tax=Salinarimonas soli TaxID=1638099 RepID=A0A5B2VCM8_9HYPH|nr:M48 family metalloprotease [Salinarimonas soli]
MVSAPVEAPRVTGVERAAEREHARLVQAFGGEYRAPAMQALLAETVARLVPATERPSETYRVTVLDSPVVNAFALPSGRLYVTRGLLALANDTAEIAGVLAHEIAHVTLRHAAARSEREQRSALIGRVMAELANNPAASAAVLSEARYDIARFSRVQEIEADQIGVRTLVASGYDPYGAVRFLESLGRAGDLRVSAAGERKAAGADMLATHPSTPERIQAATLAARRAAAPGIGAGDRSRYLAAVEGITYGDNPVDGLVRGRRFIHARLGVTFEAPEGVALENTAQAVVGASADGTRRLLFDAVQPEPGQSLEALLTSTWSDPVETGTLRSATINGLPAAVATSKGRDWSFRLAAIRVGNTTFRLIIAFRTLNPEADRAFEGALASVRALSPEEAAAVRPLKLRLVTAAEGDTAEALAARMADDDRAVDRFLVLNGLTRAGALTPGERYKIVGD